MVGSLDQGGEDGLLLSGEIIERASVVGDDVLIYFP